MAAPDQGRLLPVHQPLLDLAQVADAGGREPVADLGDPADESAVAVQHLRGLAVGVEEVPQQLHVHGGAGADADALALVLVVGHLGRLGGLVTSQPVSASTWRVSRKNSTAPFITG